MSDKVRVPARVWALTVLANVAAVVALIALDLTANEALRGSLERALLKWGFANDSAMSTATIVVVILLFIEFSLVMWLIYGVLLPRLWTKAGVQHMDGSREWSNEELIVVMLMIIIVLLIMKGT